MIKITTNTYHFKYLITDLITTYGFKNYLLVNLLINNITITSTLINIYFLQYSFSNIDIMVGFLVNKMAFLPVQY